MADAIAEGNILTLRFDDARFVVAKVLRVEPLTLHDIVHLRLYDSLVAAGPGGYDGSGEYRERSHGPIDIDDLGVGIDPLAVTSTALELSDPFVVGSAEVVEEELEGHRIWLMRRREAAIRRGLIRYDVDDAEAPNDEVEEEFDDVIVEEVDGDDTAIDDRPADDDDDATEGTDDGTDERPEMVTIEIRPWHETVFDLPIERLLRDLAPTFEREELRETLLAAAIAENRAAIGEQIGALLARLVDEGDYSAGQELLDLGEPAVGPLGETLRKATAEQAIGDLAQILADLGVEEGYEALSVELERRLDRVDSDEGARSLARAWLYAVMITGGESESLKKRLPLIASLTHNDLADDVAAAVEAVGDGGAEIDETTTERSSDPFGF